MLRASESAHNVDDAHVRAIVVAPDGSRLDVCRAVWHCGWGRRGGSWGGSWRGTCGSGRHGCCRQGYTGGDGGRRAGRGRGGILHGGCRVSWTEWPPQHAWQKRQLLSCRICPHACCMHATPARGLFCCPGFSCTGQNAFAPISMTCLVDKVWSHSGSVCWAMGKPVMVQVQFALEKRTRLRRLSHWSVVQCRWAQPWESAATTALSDPAGASLPQRAPGCWT